MELSTSPREQLANLQVLLEGFDKGVENLREILLENPEVEVDDDVWTVQLLKKGAYVTVRNYEGDSAVMAAAKLHRAVLEEFSPGVSLKTELPELGDLVNVDSRNTDLTERLKRKLFLTLYAENCDSFVRELRRCNWADTDLKKLVDANDKKNTFLQTACALPGSDRVVEELLKRGADPNLTVKDNNMSPPLVVAAERKNYGVMRIMLDVAKDRIDVNKMDRKGQTALHVVSKNRDLKMVVRLLNAGARMDISNSLGKVPISTAAMKDLMDMSLQADENMYPYDVKYRIKLFFGLFVQREERRPAATIRNQRDVERSPHQVELLETTRLCYITENYSEDRILKHPLVQSFIFLKWSKLKAFYYANLVCVILFTLFLNVFIMMGCNETGSRADAVSKTLVVLTSIFWAGIVVRELLQMWTAFGKYISNKENILDVALIASTVCSVFIPWNSEDVRLGFSVVTVLLSWSVLFVVSGRMPLLSEYTEILKTVTKNFLFFLTWYSTLLWSFSLCFYLLLRTNKSFSNVGLAFFNVIGAVNTENIRFDAAPFLSYPLFVVIIFLVLLNLLNGLAISDIQEIREAASLLSIRSRVRLIKDIEYSLMNICKRRIPLVSKVLSVDKIMVFSVHGAADDNYGYIYPNSNSSPHILIGALGRKDSMEQSVLSETMKIIDEKSVARLIQKFQDILQDIQTQHRILEICNNYQKGASNAI